MLTPAQSAENFLQQLQAETREFERRVATSGGDWIIKGFIDLFRNVYTLSSDTKVISKVMELLLLPQLVHFAERYGYKLVLSPEQNYYPDLTFIDENDYKFALDIKTTYRVNKQTASTMTLGTFTGYFRNRDTAKNITFPYNQYAAHFVLGVIYSRTEKKADEFERHSVNDLKSIPSVAKDLRIFVQPKYRIARDVPGSGNTKNIGAVNSIEELINGKGPFAILGEAVFDDYWMYYMTLDMARAVDLASPPYTNLTTYLQYRQALQGGRT